jgi:glycosyltransferase involved in cell wall biosynthesis
VNTVTGLDLPAGSPGGSVELLKDLYLGEDPLIPADVFMLGTGSPNLLPVAGKQLDGPGFWTYVDNLTKAIQQRYTDDYDVVHLQHLSFGATPALLRAFPSHPHLALVHGTDLLFAADHPTQAEVLREAAAAARAVVVPTSAMADLLRKSAQPNHVVHVPWGVPDHLLEAPPEREPHDDFRVLYAGRLTSEKGAAELIAGLSDVRLRVAAPADEFHQLAKKVDMSTVEYLGWFSRAGLWQAFAQHDLLVVPSTRLEAFGLVAVEAQACGLPVVYQPVPGLTEVLGDSAVSADLIELSDTITLLRKDPTALEDLRGAGFRNAKRFPLSKTAAELNALSVEIQR